MQSNRIQTGLFLYYDIADGNYSRVNSILKTHLLILKIPGILQLLLKALFFFIENKNKIK